MRTHGSSAATNAAAKLRSIARPSSARSDAAARSLTIEIGGLALRLNSADTEFREVLAARYSNFLRPDSAAVLEFDLKSAQPEPQAAEQPLQVLCERGRWLVWRNDFRASFDLNTRRGRLEFVPNPYAVDTLLRVVHSLLLAPAGGLLLHASGGIRAGRGFLFSGVSGAGKTTMARLAPADVRLLTDEISYLRRTNGGFHVFGTPFSGELGVQGENVSAPLAAIYLIEHGAENRMTLVPEPEAARRLMRNTLFFARDSRLVDAVFSTVCELTGQVPVFRLEFVPDSRVWGFVQ